MIPRLDILMTCRHWAQFRCCDDCRDFPGTHDYCLIQEDWKAAVHAHLHSASYTPTPHTPASLHPAPEVPDAS